MAEIIKYKFFLSSEEFEQWQKEEIPKNIHGIAPLPFDIKTNGVVDPSNGLVDTYTIPIHQIFVTYTEYEFPTEETYET